MQSGGTPAVFTVMNKDALKAGDRVADDVNEVEKVMILFGIESSNLPRRVAIIGSRIQYVFVFLAVWPLSQIPQSFTCTFAIVSTYNC